MFCVDETAVPDNPAFGGPSSPLYTSPSSPGENDKVEQKPSEDDINRVNPSLDLRHS